MSKPDLYQSIQGQDHRSIIVDDYDSGAGVYVAIHVPGGFSSIALSIDAAIELKNAIQSVIGVNNDNI